MIQFKLIHSFNITGETSSAFADWMVQLSNQLEIALPHHSNWSPSFQLDIFSNELILPGEVNGRIHFDSLWSDNNYISPGYIKFTGNIFAHYLFVGKRMENKWVQLGENITLADRKQRAFLISEAVLGTLNYYNNTFVIAPNGFIWVINKSDYDGNNPIPIEDVDISGLRYSSSNVEKFKTGIISFLAGDLTKAEKQLSEYTQDDMLNNKRISLNIKWINKYEIEVMNVITVKTVNWKIIALQKVKKMNRYKVKARRL